MLYCPTTQWGEGGAVRHQRGESHRRWLITVVLIITYDTESKSRNADFMLIAQGAIPPPSAPQALSPPERSEHNPPPTGGHNLRPGGPSTFLVTPLLHNPRRQPRPFFIICGGAATTTLGAKGPVKLKNPPAIRPVHLKNPHTEGVFHEPSHRRRVQPPLYYLKEFYFFARMVLLSVREVRNVFT